MPNVLNNLAADLYTAADKVSRELTGFIPAVTLNADSARAAKGDPIRSHFTRAATAIDRNVGMVVSEGTSQTVDSKTVTITKDRAVEIPWEGEEIRHVNNGSGFETIYGDQAQQAMRALVNEMESDIASAAYLGASRAYGTPGSTPFATAGDFTDASFTKQILVDNGAGEFGNQLVMNTTAGAMIQGKQAAANVAGTDSLQRQGILLPLSGLDLRQSAQVKSHVAGTVVDATVTGANSVGATAIGVTTAATTGSVNLAAGDIVTFAGDTNKYVVAQAVTIGAGTTGTITLQAPGLRVATAGTEMISIVASSVRNVAFARSAIELVARAPATPVIGGVARDAAVDRMMIVDPVSGLPFEFSVYLGQGKAMIQCAMAWGVKVWKPEHVASLLG
jgi:hypothetical protein